MNASTPTQVDTQVLAILAQLTTVPLTDIRREDRLRADLGLDSVASMELLGMLADTFDIEVPLEETLAVQSVQEVLDLTNRYIARA